MTGEGVNLSRRPNDKHLDVASAGSNGSHALCLLAPGSKKVQLRRRQSDWRGLVHACAIIIAGAMAVLGRKEDEEIG